MLVRGILDLEIGSLLYLLPPRLISYSRFVATISNCQIEQYIIHICVNMKVNNCSRESPADCKRASGVPIRMRSQNIIEA